MSKPYDQLPLGSVIDCRQWPNEDVIGYFDELTIHEEKVLHGSNNPYIPLLKAQQAYDLYRESGRQRALYATDVAPLAIFNAIYNRAYSRQMAQRIGLPSERFAVTHSHATDSRRCEFKFMPQVGELIRTYIEFAPQDTLYGLQAGNPLTSGHVYAFNRTDFERVADEPAEWTHGEPIAPTSVFHISASLGRTLFAKENWISFLNPETPSQRFVVASFTWPEILERRAILEREQLLKPAVKRLL